ncbi:hypothetical protein AUJ77_01355 [Candidatus Nomurabacteria bacterium CG1_02_43_90]|uniref:Uncharacterized protein n=1 Tax=Candidatus Nomurabacteria bacterium CG1_02_43_90 TaxID=1805281 RepID=A0A1J4V4P8_9BACT|nr:MAG: hypothetical protein AUJ77_01355 [Candidatus Nomurabacteria bacterium CG1_02_43_90]
MNMTKQIISALKVISLSLILAFGVSYVSAWTAPTVTPPGGNVAQPINVSSAPQTKTGSLTTGSLTTGRLTLIGDAYATSKVYFKSSIGGPNAGALVMTTGFSGFSNTADNNYRMYVTDTTTPKASGFGNVVANDYYIAKTGEWASQMGGSAGGYGYTTSGYTGRLSTICTSPNPKTGKCNCPTGSTSISMGVRNIFVVSWYSSIYYSVLCVY